MPRALSLFTHHHRHHHHIIEPKRKTTAASNRNYGERHARRKQVEQRMRSTSIYLYI